MDDAEDFERLSPTEMDMKLFLEGGGSLDDLVGGGASVTQTDGSLTVPFTHDNGETETVSLDVFLPLAGLRTAFAEVIALRTQEIERQSLHIDIGKLSKFVDFLNDRSRQLLELEAIDNGLLGDFRAWLDEQRSPPVTGTGRSRYAATQREGGELLSVAYKKEVYRTLVDLLQRLRIQSKYRARMQPDLDLNLHGAWTKRGGRARVPILTRPELKMLVRLCREEVIATSLRIRAFWAICDGSATDGDTALVDPALAREVSAMADFFGEDLPPTSRTKLKVVKHTDDEGVVIAEFSRRTFPLIWATNGAGYEAAVTLLYPTPTRMLPFCLLFAVYYRYNPSVLAALKASDLKRQPSVFGERLQGTPFKNRAKRKQHASWPITPDAHNPAEMIKTIERWKARIADQAPFEQHGHLFLFRDETRKTHSFATTNALRRHVGIFLRRHSGKSDEKGAKLDQRRFSPRSIRPSVIDLVHHLFDGDVIAASHAGNHRYVDTTIEHYLYDGARKRNDEALAPVTDAMQRWVETDGVIDPRIAGQSRTMAATPGWECDSPRSGHIAGEEPGVACRAYGRCVSCELGSTQFDSPVCYALGTKLRDAMLRARTTMPEHAWLSRWQSELDLLERILVLKFTPAAIEAANLDIPNLPTVE